MGDMLELLIHFRTNKYVLLADIRKAFLMIHLDLEKDRNCFYKKGAKTCIVTHALPSYLVSM